MSIVEDLSWCIAATVIIVMLPIDGTATLAVPYALLYSIKEVGWLVLAAAVDTNIGIILMSNPTKRRRVIVAVRFFRVFFSPLFWVFLVTAPLTLGAPRGIATEVSEITATDAPRHSRLPLQTGLSRKRYPR